MGLAGSVESDMFNKKSALGRSSFSRRGYLTPLSGEIIVTVHRDGVDSTNSSGNG